MSVRTKIILGDEGAYYRSKEDSTLTIASIQLFIKNAFCTEKQYDIYYKSLSNQVKVIESDSHLNSIIKFTTDCTLILEPRKEIASVVEQEPCKDIKEKKQIIDMPREEIKEQKPLVIRMPCEEINEQKPLIISCEEAKELNPLVIRKVCYSDKICPLEENKGSINSEASVAIQKHEDTKESLASIVIQKHEDMKDSHAIVAIQKHKDMKESQSDSTQEDEIELYDYNVAVTKQIADVIISQCHNSSDESIDSIVASLFPTEITQLLKKQDRYYESIAAIKNLSADKKAQLVDCLMKKLQ